MKANTVSFLISIFLCGGNETVGRLMAWSVFVQHEHHRYQATINHKEHINLQARDVWQGCIYMRGASANPGQKPYLLWPYGRFFSLLLASQVPGAIALMAATMESKDMTYLANKAPITDYSISTDCESFAVGFANWMAFP